MCVELPYSGRLTRCTCKSHTQKWLFFGMQNQFHLFMARIEKLVKRIFNSESEMITWDQCSSNLMSFTAKWRSINFGFVFRLTERSTVVLCLSIEFHAASFKFIDIKLIMSLLNFIHYLASSKKSKGFIIYQELGCLFIRPLNGVFVVHFHSPFFFSSDHWKSAEQKTKIHNLNRTVDLLASGWCFTIFASINAIQFNALQYWVALIITTYFRPLQNVHCSENGEPFDGSFAIYHFHKQFPIYKINQKFCFFFFQ